MAKRRRLHYNELRWLTPDAYEAVTVFVKRLADKGLSPQVAETYRPQDAQNRIVEKSAALVAAGKAPLTKTTQSWHTVGRAVDVNISPATWENVLYFLDTARDLGFRTLADPDKIRAASTDQERNKLSWDWHHVEFRNGRDYAHAATEYKQLLARGPSKVPELSEILSGVLMTGALASAYKNV